MSIVQRMAKKKGTKLRASNQHEEIDEARISEYERLRMLRIRENELKLQALGVGEKARSLKVSIQSKNGNKGKDRGKKAMRDDELYKLPEGPNIDIEQEHHSFVEETLSDQSYKCTPRKLSKMKKSKRKAIGLAIAFKKRQQDVQLNASPLRKSAPASQTNSKLVVADQQSSRNDTENGGIRTSRRGPTMCNKVYGRSLEERLEITLNEHGQPVGPDDATCNEFISFLGTIARKTNILPLTVPMWPKLRNEKQDELWEYVTKHYIISVEAKKWVMQTIGSCWRQYKCTLKRKHFLPFDNDDLRKKKRPKGVPEKMFSKLLKIWNDGDYRKRCMKNKANRLVGKEKNIMHTSGPKSFARVRYNWKKARKTTQNPTLGQMFIETRKEKRTKRKPDDLRDKLIGELKEVDTEKAVENVISTLTGSNNKKKRQLHLHGRGVSCTQLKQKAMMRDLEKKHAEQMEAMQNHYEDKRQEERKEVANGLQSLFAQWQQQSPHISVDLSMFGSFFLDDQSMIDANSTELLRLHSSASTSKEVNDIEEEEDGDGDGDGDEDEDEDEHDEED